MQLSKIVGPTGLRTVGDVLCTNSKCQTKAGIVVVDGIAVAFEGGYIMKIGFAVCGSFCTFSEVFPIMEELTETFDVIPIFSFASASVDSRFGTAQEHMKRAERICKIEPLHSIEAVEPIGPKKLLDALIVAPCTGNTLAKLAHSIADSPVTMAAKSHLRNNRPVIIAISTNDALAGAAENIGKLLA